MKTLYNRRRGDAKSLLLQVFMVVGLLSWQAASGYGQAESDSQVVSPSPATLSLLTAPDESPAAHISSDVIVVGVNIRKISQIDNLDFLTDQADFWVNVQINSISVSFSMDSPTWENQDVAEPNWAVRSFAKKGEAVSIRISVGERDWPGSTEIDVNPGSDRAFSINLWAEKGKKYTYTKEGDEDPGWFKEKGCRAKIELDIIMEDFFVQTAKDGKSVLSALADITNYYAPRNDNWFSSPWGGAGKMWQDAWSVNFESAGMQLFWYVAAAGLLTPAALVANHVASDVAQKIISFIFGEYVQFYAKEYRMTKPTGSQYLGLDDENKMNQLSTTYQLNKDLIDLGKLYDAEIAGYADEVRLAAALKSEINKLSEAVKKAEFIYKNIKGLVDLNYVVHETIEGRKYRSGETGKPSYEIFEMVYQTLNNELAYKQFLYKGFTPDIRVKALTASPAAPVANQAVTFSLTVENIGGFPANSNLYRSYDVYVNGKNVISRRSEPAKGVLLPADTWSTTFSYTFPEAGSYSVIVAVDTTSDAVEYSESNNEKSIALNVAPVPLPDIRVKDLSCTPAVPVANQPVTIRATIENVGKAPAAGTGYSSYDLYANKKSIGNPRGGPGQGPLQPGKTWPATYSYTFPSAGLYTIKIAVDPENSVPESSETNNEKSISVNVLPPPPDLIVDEFTCIPSGSWKMTGKGLVSFSIRIKNTGAGPADATGYASYNILADGVAIRKVRKADGLPPLQPGKTWSDENSYTFSDGKSHKLSVVVDPENKVLETSETNNDKTVNLQPLLQEVDAKPTELLPDIKVVSMTISPAIPRQREADTLTVVVENAGKKACPENGFSSYDLYLNGDLYAQNRKETGTDLLQPGKTWTTTIPCTFLVAGANKLKIVMDPENKVKEISEKNNEFTSTFKVIEVKVSPF